MRTPFDMPERMSELTPNCQLMSTDHRVCNLFVTRRLTSPSRQQQVLCPISPPSPQSLPGRPRSRQRPPPRKHKHLRANADFHAGGSAQLSGEYISDGSPRPRRRRYPRSGLLLAQAGDDQLAEGPGVAGQRGPRARWGGCGPGLSKVIAVNSDRAGLRTYLTSERERIRKAANLTPRASSSPRISWVATFSSMISILGSDRRLRSSGRRRRWPPGPWLANADIGVDDVGGAGVLADSAYRMVASWATFSVPPGPVGKDRSPGWPKGAVCKTQLGPRSWDFRHSYGSASRLWSPVGVGAEYQADTTSQSGERLRLCSGRP